MRKLVVLIFSDYYLPAIKAGGPIRTISNLVKQLSDKFSFKIITRDRDYNDRSSFPGISVNSWQTVDKASVLYLSPNLLSMRVLTEIICGTPHNLIYLNSFFSLQFTIKPLLLRRLGKIPNVPVILAPRGELAQQALAIKRLKKYLYLSVALRFNFFKNVLYQASSFYEEQDIYRSLGKNAAVQIAPDISTVANDIVVKSRFCKKRAGNLKVIFLSRISRIKNLYGALKILAGIKGNIKFDIFGPKEDIAYWHECEEVLHSLPKNIDANYLGIVDHDRAYHVFQEYHLFLFPTKSENFGHVILESLANGCPVLTSDQVPWQNLEEKGAGWSFPLDKVDIFRDVLQKCVDMDEKDFIKFQLNAINYANHYYNTSLAVEKQCHLFETALSYFSNELKKI
jgi:glycosyltransferase involved in cell wall biosynthesis